MSVAKIIEISSESETSFEQAVCEGVKRASKTVQNIKAAWIKNQSVCVEDNQVKKFRVDMKITFLLKE